MWKYLLQMHLKPGVADVTCLYRYITGKCILLENWWVSGTHPYASVPFAFLWSTSNSIPLMTANHCLVLVATWNCCFYCIDNGKHKINEKLSLHCEHFHWKKARLAINMKNWRNLLKLREDLIDGCFRFHLNCYVSRNYNYVVYCNLWLNFGNLSGI